VTVRERPVPPVEEPEEWWVLNAWIEGVLNNPFFAILGVLGDVAIFALSMLF